MFVPGLVAVEEIRAVVAATTLPLNLLAWRGLPSAAELQALGVRRLSAGSAIAESIWERAAALTKEFLAEGRSEPLFESAIPYGELNTLFKPRA